MVLNSDFNVARREKIVALSAVLCITSRTPSLCHANTSVRGAPIHHAIPMSWSKFGMHNKLSRKSCARPLIWQIRFCTRKKRFWMFSVTWKVLRLPCCRLTFQFQVLLPLVLLLQERIDFPREQIVSSERKKTTTGLGCWALTIAGTEPRPGPSLLT